MNAAKTQLSAEERAKLRPSTIAKSSNMHGQGWSQINPGHVFSSYTDAPKNNGKKCLVLRAVVESDGDPYWDVRIGKSWVELEDGTEICVLNDEVN